MAVPKLSWCLSTLVDFPHYRFQSYLLFRFECSSDNVVLNLYTRSAVDFPVTVLGTVRNLNRILPTRSAQRWLLLLACPIVAAWWDSERCVYVDSLHEVLELFTCTWQVIDQIQENLANHDLQRRCHTLLRILITVLLFIDG